MSEPLSQNFDFAVPIALGQLYQQQHVQLGQIRISKAPPLRHPPAEVIPLEGDEMAKFGKASR